MSAQNEFLQLLNNPEKIFVATDNELFLHTVAQNLAVVVEKASPNQDLVGFSEPTNPLEASIWKLDQVNVEGVVLASDIGVKIDGDEMSQVKPKRDPECAQINEEFGIPQKILDRYSKKGGTYVVWEVPFAVKLEDGSVRLAAITIETIAPELTPTQIQQYYSDNSSAGIFLTALLRDQFPQNIYIMRNHFGDEVVQISHEIAWEFIVNKTPSLEVLSQLISKEASTILVGEREVGLVSISLIGIFDTDVETHPNVVAQEFLRDGTPVTVETMNIADVAAVMQLMYKNFEESPSYVDENHEVVEAYKRANSQHEIALARMNETDTTSIVVRDEGGDLLGYAMVKNGRYTETGAPIFSIKRLHTHLDWQKGQGVGSVLVRQVEEFAKKRYPNREVVLEVGASGTSASFYEKRGFAATYVGNNPVFEKRGFHAHQYVEMRKVIC